MLINDLKKRMGNNPFFHMNGTSEEKIYIRANGCTYKEKIVYGGTVAIIKDKKTGEKIELPVYKEGAWYNELLNNSYNILYCWSINRTHIDIVKG